MFSSETLEKHTVVNHSCAITQKMKIILGKLNETSSIEKLLARGFDPWHPLWDTTVTVAPTQPPFQVL
uniref:Cellulose synthase n=1 Tax=Solanum tuberosum TaxID=4113 RepID=M1B1E3_SOLTU